MQKARICFVLSLGLFAGWIGWLGYLAFGTHGQIVLSRPQLLVSNLKVVASLSGDADYADGNATVREVLSATDPSIKIAKGTRLKVHDLELCAPENGWRGPGDYILALMWRKDHKAIEQEAVAVVGSPLASLALATAAIGSQVSLTLVPSSPGFPLATEVRAGGFTELVKSQISLYERIARALASVKDQETFAAMQVKMRRLFPEAREMQRHAQALGSMPVEVRKQLAAAGYAEEAECAGNKMLKEMQRVSKLDVPGIGEFLDSLRTYDSPQEDRLRIYPATRQTLEQVKHIENSWK